MGGTTGKFIVLEGIDGSGKSEQIKRLKIFFKSRDDVFFTQEPTVGNPISALIGKVLKGEWETDDQTLQTLFTADRSHHLAKEIIPALKRGEHVICDRYVFSTLAYGGDHVPDALKVLNRNFLVPDLTLFVSVSPEIAMSRLHKRSGKATIFELESTLGKIAGRYDALLSTFGKVVRIDGERSADEVFADGKIEIINEDYKKRSNEKANVEAKFENKVALIHIYPGIDPSIMDYYIKNDYKGIVLPLEVIDKLRRRKLVV